MVLGQIIFVEPIFSSFFLDHHAFVEQKLQEFFEFGLPIGLSNYLNISLLKCCDEFAIGQDFARREGLCQCISMLRVA